MLHKDNHINYIEVKVSNLKDTKQFFETVFGWTFKDFGKHYTTFTNAGLMGGFIEEVSTFSPTSDSPLIVIFKKNLEQTMKDITQAGGTITTYPFSFPGGRRFHFTDLNNNEFAVWTDDE